MIAPGAIVRSARGEISSTPAPLPGKLSVGAEGSAHYPLPLWLPDGGMGV